MPGQPPESTPPLRPPDADQSSGDAWTYADRSAAGERPADPPSGSGSHADEPTRVAHGGHVPAGVPEAPVIPGYEIESEVHRGGQGIVYRATQLGTKRPVALKVLLEGPFATETARRRFEREIELAASLRHPHIVTLLESGLAHGRYFFAMEFIDGLRLDHYVRDRKPGLRETLVLLTKICDAVAFAHLRGVIHRDLKPSNILVDAAGEPHVFDFGLAKSSTGGDPFETTIQVVSTTGQLIGTLAYMSPEQAVGAQDLDVRSDVYSLGVIAYEMLLETLPYPVAGPLAETLRRIAEQEPTPPRALRHLTRLGKAIDDEVETILLKALEKEPVRRYQTAGELAADLRRYLAGEPIEAKRASGLYVLRKTLKRYRLQALAAAAMLALLVVFLVLFAVQYRQERELRERSELLEQQAKQSLGEAEEAARAAEAAGLREREQRRVAEESAAQAQRAAEDLRHALSQQKIQRGDLARLGGDLAAARDSYWQAHLDDPALPGPLLALRQYYAESGEVDARQLAFGAYGPGALSADGTRVLVSSGPTAIEVRGVADGELLGWHALPGPARAAWLDGQGHVAVVGDDWAWTWGPGSSRPDGEIAWSGRIEARWVCYAPAARTLAIVSSDRVHVFDAPSGTLRSQRALAGRVTGEPDLSADGRHFVAPTDAGLQRVSLDRGGATEIIWGDAAGPRVSAARFIGPQKLAVLGGAVAVADLGRTPLQWQRLAQVGEGYSRLAVRGERVAVAHGDGRVAIFRGAALERAWSVRAGGLVDVEWSPDGAHLLTLDDEARLTRWQPPGASEQRRVLQARPVARWTRAPDGAGLVWVDSAGQAAAYAPQVREGPIAVALPDLLETITGRRPEAFRLAFAGDPPTAYVYHGGRIWQRNVERARAIPLRLAAARGSEVGGLAFRADGSMAAIQIGSVRGERELVSFFDADGLRSWDDGQIDPRSDALETVEFVGSPIVGMAFIPGTPALLLARANGALVKLDAPHRPQAGPPQKARTAPWIELDAAITLLDLARDGRFAAVACDDGAVRVIGLGDGLELGRLTARGVIDALAFNHAGTLLLVRTRDGAIEFFDTIRFERVARWELPWNAPEPAFATFVGRDDRLVFNAAEGVVEVRFDLAEQRIAANRPLALERSATLALEQRNYPAAAELAAGLAALDAGRGRRLELALLERALRRPGTDPPARVLAAVLQHADRTDLVRLGHAAFAGERFEQARTWLAAAAADAPEQHDAYTRLRYAEANYLCDELDAAVAEFAALTTSAGLAPGDAARVRLETLAGLVLSGKVEEARVMLGELQRRRAARNQAEALGMVATLAIGNYLIDGGANQALAATFRRLLGVLEERWLEYRDDMEFYAGELARRRGDFDAARDHYLESLRVARDNWPSAWARWRLRQLASQPAAESQP